MSIIEYIAVARTVCMQLFIIGVLVSTSIFWIFWGTSIFKASELIEISSFVLCVVEVQTVQRSSRHRGWRLIKYSSSTAQC